VIVLRNVVKAYKTSRGEIRALDGVELHVGSGEFVVVRGPSGSGKTTLLMTIAAMLRPTRGTVTVDGRNLHQMSARERARFRACTVGFIFQMFHLVPYLNVLDNVVLASGAGGKSEAKARAGELLGQLGMKERALHKPSELSAGEGQRTAIARALLNNPKILLADEPTGNLDRENAIAVLGYLSDFHKRGGTVVVATHETEAESFADKVVSLRNGGLG
jgi:ABC-type lipoprotein export system ATPase subunit